MKELLWLFVAYILFLAGVYVFQRKLVYFPDRRRVPPASLGFTGLGEEVVTAPDGTELVGWSATPKGKRKTVLYFHGNAGNIAFRAERFRHFRSRGYGLLGLNYRSYGGSGGRPSEKALVGDALLAHDTLTGRGVKPEDIIIYGESLGTAIATQVAAQRPAAALILEAPFTSAVDLGAKAYWYLPVRLLMRDRFRTVDHIGRIDMPLMVLHGRDDEVVPVGFARAVYDKAAEPKRMVIVDGAGHADLYAHDAWRRVLGFLRDHGLDN